MPNPPSGRVATRACGACRERFRVLRHRRAASRCASLTAAPGGSAGSVPSEAVSQRAIWCGANTPAARATEPTSAVTWRPRTASFVLDLRRCELWAFSHARSPARRDASPAARLAVAVAPDRNSWMIRVMTRRFLMAVGMMALATQPRLAAERLPLRNYRTADGCRTTASSRSCATPAAFYGSAPSKASRASTAIGSRAIRSTTACPINRSTTSSRSHPALTGSRPTAAAFRDSTRTGRASRRFH